jgi:hypothetical protein
MEQLAGGDSNSAVVFSITSKPDRVDVTLSPSGMLSAKVFSDGTAPPAGAFNIDFTVANKFGLSTPGRAYLSIGPGGTPYLSFAPVARNFVLGGGMGQKLSIARKDAHDFDGNINGYAKFVVDTQGAGTAEVIDDGATIEWEPPRITYEGKTSFTYHIENYALVDGTLVRAGRSQDAKVSISEEATLARFAASPFNKSNPPAIVGFQQQWKLSAGGLTDGPVVIIQKVHVVISNIDGAYGVTYLEDDDDPTPVDFSHALRRFVPGELGTNERQFDADQPEQGSISQSTTEPGGWIYTPKKGFVGEDTFKFRIFDGFEWSSKAVFHVMIPHVCRCQNDEVLMASNDPDDDDHHDFTEPDHSQDTPKPPPSDGNDWTTNNTFSYLFPDAAGFDWNLNYGSHEVTMIMHLYINPIDPVAARMQYQFASALKSAAEQTFNSGSVKIYPTNNPADCRPWTPKLELRFEWLQPRGITINLSSTPERSGTTWPGNDVNNISMDLDLDDVKMDDGQISAVHEIGHAFGLRHPGVVVYHNGDYQGYHYDVNALMGRGMELRAAYFSTWAQYLNGRLRGGAFIPSGGN